MIFGGLIMKRQLQGIAVLLLSILLTIAYGNEAIFDFSLRWHTIFVLIGIAGVIMTFLPSKNNEK